MIHAAPKPKSMVLVPYNVFCRLENKHTRYNTHDAHMNNKLLKTWCSNKKSTVCATEQSIVVLIQKYGIMNTNHQIMQPYTVCSHRNVDNF